MEFTLTFKTNDVLDQVIKRLAPLTPMQIREIEEFAEDYIEYGEYIRVEFNTETGTVIVLPLPR